MRVCVCVCVYIYIYIYIEHVCMCIYARMHVRGSSAALLKNCDPRDLSIDKDRTGAIYMHCVYIYMAVFALKYIGGQSIKEDSALESKGTCCLACRCGGRGSRCRRNNPARPNICIYSKYIYILIYKYTESQEIIQPGLTY
jgi:hypothetical protein